LLSISFVPVLFSAKKIYFSELLWEGFSFPKILISYPEYLIPWAAIEDGGPISPQNTPLFFKKRFKGGSGIYKISPQGESIPVFSFITRAAICSQRNFFPKSLMGISWNVFFF